MCLHIQQPQPRSPEFHVTLIFGVLSQKRTSPHVFMCGWKFFHWTWKPESQKFKICASQLNEARSAHRDSVGAHPEPKKSFRVTGCACSVNSDGQVCQEQTLGGEGVPSGPEVRLPHGRAAASQRRTVLVTAFGLAFSTPAPQASGTWWYSAAGQGGRGKASCALWEGGQPLTSTHRHQERPPSCDT